MIYPVTHGCSSYFIEYTIKTSQPILHTTTNPYNCILEGIVSHVLIQPTIMEMRLICTQGVHINIPLI